MRTEEPPSKGNNFNKQNEKYFPCVLLLLLRDLVHGICRIFAKFLLFFSLTLIVILDSCRLKPNRCDIFFSENLYLFLSIVSVIVDTTNEYTFFIYEKFFSHLKSQK